MTSFLERVAGPAEYRTGPTSTLADPTEWLLDALRSTATYSGQTVSLDKALSLTPFRTAVMLISETIGMLPFKVYRDLGEGRKDEQRDHRSWRMLHDKPNTITTAHRFWSTVATHLLIWNNAYLEKLRNEGGLVTELWTRDPSKVVVEWDDSTKRKRFYEDTMGGRRYWTDEQMLHIPGWSVNGITGESMLYRGRNTIGNALAREEFEGGFYKRGAVLSLVIKHPGVLKDSGIKRLKGMFNSNYAGSGKAHGTPVLEEGASIEKVSPTLQELQFEEAQQRSRTEIAIMFRIPPAFLGGSTGDSLTYATRESNVTQFAQQAIQPLTTTIESAIAADPGIFPFQSWFPEFVLDGLLRADSQARAEFYNTMRRAGAMVPNEMRALENLPPIEGGDKLPEPQTIPTTDQLDSAADSEPAAA